jgi:hypothetical protein
MTERRFPSPWSVEEQDACYVGDRGGQAFACLFRGWAATVQCRVSALDGQPVCVEVNSRSRMMRSEPGVLDYLNERCGMN